MTDTASHSFKSKRSRIITFDRGIEPEQMFNPAVARQKIAFVRPARHYAMGVGFGLFLSAGMLLLAVAVTYVFVHGRQPLLSLDVVLSLLGVWSAAIVSSMFGIMLMLDERELRDARRDVQFDETGVVAEDYCDGARQSWSEPYAGFLGVVLSVSYGEIENSNSQSIELRHFDKRRTLLLYKNKGSGLSPAIRNQARDTARRMGLKAFVEVQGDLLPLE